MRGATSIPTRIPTTATTATKQRKTAAAIRPSTPTSPKDSRPSPVVGRCRQLSAGDADCEAGARRRVRGRVTDDPAILGATDDGVPAIERRLRAEDRKRSARRLE